jgi:outer membrane protein OmpA-like peptidoglycan-associated protein
MALKKIFIAFCLLFTSDLFGQLGELERFDCTYSKEITLPFNYSETKSIVKPQLNQVVFYSYRDQFTYWYKITSKIDDKVNFKVSAINDSDSYAIFVYQYNSVDFCSQLYTQKIKPISSSYYVGKGSELSDLNFKTLSVKKDNIYYISVVNTSLNNCGHNFILNHKADSLKVKAYHSPCKKDISVLPVTKDLGLKNIEVTPDNKNEITKVSKDSVTEIKKTASSTTITPLEIKNTEIKPLLKDSVAVIRNSDDKIQDLSYSKIVCYTKDKKKLSLVKSQLSLLNMETKEYISFTNVSVGKCELVLEKGIEYKIKSVALGYKELELKITNKDENELELLLEPLNVGDNFVMKSIYFHPNTFALRKESAGDLQKLLNFMLDNPLIVIEIQGHTNGDNKIFKNKAYEQLGDEWNFQGSSKKLSMHRSEAIKKYLVNNGISEDRLVAVGKGGEKPIIENPETMEDGQRNIRVEVIILKN